MTGQLTYSDRSHLLQVFDGFRAEWHQNDAGLLRSVFKWTRALSPSFGFEKELIRDITELSNYLASQKLTPDLANIARGGLLYVLHSHKAHPQENKMLDMLGIAFITGYAIHEIRTRLGEPAIYSPPRLAGDEQKRAENLFLDLIDKPSTDDRNLIVRARGILGGMKTLADCGYLLRFRRNVEYLLSFIGNPNSSQEHRTYACAAVNYFIRVNDAVDDRLGIAGYLDDIFIAQLAVDLINPTRTPWVDILDEIAAAWPFLNSLIIHEDGDWPVSEFMMINAGLLCPSLREAESTHSILVIPDTGPLPFFLGFFATLGLLYQSAERKQGEESFHPGQKVLVDNNAVAEFDGMMEVYGKRMFGLKQYTRARGHPLATTRYWPITELQRIVPVDPDRLIRGDLTRDLDHSDAPVPALDFVFHANKTEQLSTVVKKILVVSSLRETHTLAERLSLYTYPLKDVLPMGHLSGDQIRPWSTRFGQQDPILVFARDLDSACLYAESHLEEIEKIVVDFSEGNETKTASISTLLHLPVGLLVVAPERHVESLPDFSGEMIHVWEWQTADFSSLLWAEIPGAAKGVIGNYEQNVRDASLYSPREFHIDDSLAEEIFDSLSDLKSIVQQRGDDQLLENEQLVDIAFQTGLRLMRTSTTMEAGDWSVLQTEKDLHQMDLIIMNSQYQSEAEKAASKSTRNLLESFYKKLGARNQKSDIIRDLIQENPGITIISPHPRYLDELERDYGRRGHKILTNRNITDLQNAHGVIVPGWFGRKRMSRILTPPITQPLYLVLYGIEQRWHIQYQDNVKAARIRRASQFPRNRVFPFVKGWIDSPSESPAHPASQLIRLSPDLDALQGYVLNNLRNNAYRTAQSDGSEMTVPARLVLFDGGFHAFLRNSYRAIVVTHLLDEPPLSPEEEVDVERKPTGELKPNDALLFHRRSNRDVIRIAADKELPKGLRETATLWRRSLVEYTKQTGSDPEEIWKLLSNHGCPLAPQTIRGWLEDEDMIGPRQYERDVPIIAEATGDHQLSGQIPVVLAAIRTVFGAHQRASHMLALAVRQHALKMLQDVTGRTRLVEEDSDIILVRIMEIDTVETNVRFSVVNQLLESEHWQE